MEFILKNIHKIKILYAVNGDGLGHAGRSIPIILHLAKKHDVLVLAGSKRAAEFIRKKYPNTIRYNGWSFQYNNNSLDLLNSLKKNILNTFNEENIKKTYPLIKNYSPDIILTDCDHLTIYQGIFLKKPIICICNLHCLSEMKFDVDKKYKSAYDINKILYNTLSDKIDYHILTTFLDYPINANKKNKVFVYPPVLRNEIIDAKPLRKNHYLVYQTSTTNKKLINILKKTSTKFIVYGFDKDETDKNIIFKKTNDDQFFKDFKNCRACITNGGHSFISEAIAMHKPILSIPIKYQFEQILNALEIEKKGYGIMCEDITLSCLNDFIKNNDKYYKNLKEINIRNKNNNKHIFSKIDELIKKLVKI